MNEVKVKYDLKLLLFSALAIVALAASFFFYWDTTKVVIRMLLEARFTYFLLWVVTLLIFMTHYFRHKAKGVQSEVIITRKFGLFIDNALGGVGYGTTITTTLTLLKGLYIQTFFKDKQYFLDFGDLDLMTMFGVMLFLLYVVVVKVVDVAQETYKVNHTEQVKNAQNEILVPPDIEDPR